MEQSDGQTGFPEVTGKNERQTGKNNRKEYGCLCEEVTSGRIHRTVITDR